MEKLFVLQNPWWMLVLRDVLVYLGVIVMPRFSGKREVGQFTPFDLALLLIVSEAVPMLCPRRSRPGPPACWR